jgi:peptidoglycan hydrolase-like protein with peptidoglycan-binding domain
MSELKNGSSGGAVKSLQEKLSKLGFKVAVDGSFGKGTEAAVIDLQKTFGIKVDGIVGEKTKSLLDEQLGKGFNINAQAMGDAAPSKSTK